MEKFNVVIKQEDTKKILHLDGSLDEDFIFTKFPLAGASEIEFHLSNLTHINSCGIREWLKWLGTVADVKTKFFACPKIFVDQMNMVQGFLPQNGVVESFYVPYFNEDTGSEKLVLFSKGKEFANGEVIPPSEIKDDKANLMEMDVVTAKYFKFLKNK